MSLYDICPDGLVLHIYAQPGARKSEINGQYQDRIKVRIASPPVDGKANKELIKFFSNLCMVSKSRVSLLLGEKNRNKKILIKIDEDEKLQSVLQQLNNLINKR